MITLENFGEFKRERLIGHSQYRICNTEPEKGTGKWYIHESFNNGKEWVANNGYYSDSLQEVIEKINSFGKEKEVISLRFPM